MINIRDSVLLNDLSVREKWPRDTTDPSNDKNRSPAHTCSASAQQEICVGV